MNAEQGHGSGASDAPRYRSMTDADLDAVIAIEKSIYAAPWTLGNFRDSLAAGYHCRVVERSTQIVAYTVIAIAAGEAHLLNLSVALAWQRRGLGRELLGFVTRLACECSARILLLEVRPSNHAARALYEGAGFTQIGVRRGYYPGDPDREDALVLARELSQ